MHLLTGELITNCANAQVTLSEIEEIMTRCVLQKSKVAEDNLPQQTDLFLKKFLRSNL